MSSPSAFREDRLEAALKGLVAVRPTNWDDDEDPAQAAAWRAADEALADQRSSFDAAFLERFSVAALVELRRVAAAILHRRYRKGGR